MNDDQYNIKKLKDAEFFILRSTCDDDIHKAIKYGFWTSTHGTNIILNDTLRSCQRRGIPLFLIFTLFNKSCQLRTVLWNCRNDF